MINKLSVSLSSEPYLQGANFVEHLFPVFVYKNTGKLYVFLGSNTGEKGPCLEVPCNELSIKQGKMVCFWPQEKHGMFFKWWDN